MKIKILTILSLAAILFLGGCRGDSNTNTNSVLRTNANANMTAATPVMVDTATKSTVEAAMKNKGFNDVVVEATTTGVTLRGSVPKGKMAEAVQAAQEAGKKSVKNELIEK